MSLESRNGGNDSPLGDDSTLAWHKVGVILIGVVAVGCLHALLYHLHSILVPFVLSGFIVLALQPAVEVTYSFLAGLRAPYRWCLCGCIRRRYFEDNPRWSDIEAHNQAAVMTPREDQPLLEMATESFWTKAMDGFMRLLAVTLILSLLVAFIFFVCFVLGRGAIHMKDDWQSYQAGYIRLGKRLDGYVNAVSNELRISEQSDHQLKEVYGTILSKAQDYVLDIVNAIVSGLSGGLTSGAIMLLYVLFWLMEPLPTGGKTAGALVRSYLYKKTFVSFLYGSCVMLLFFLLGIDLAALFGMIAFFLNFLPEVGAIMSCIFPAPVILLDGRIANPFQVLIASVVGQLILKFLFGNILEVKLIERDKEMSIHPVWVILGLCYFGFVWGPMGMLISVPMLAMVKTAALSIQEAVIDEQSESSFRMAESFLTCVEGRSARKESRSNFPKPSPVSPTSASALSSRQ